MANHTSPEADETCRRFIIICDVIERTQAVTSVYFGPQIKTDRHWTQESYRFSVGIKIITALVRQIRTMRSQLDLSVLDTEAQTQFNQTLDGFDGYACRLDSLRQRNDQQVQRANAHYLAHPELFIQQPIHN